jgi:hypothetical protein
LSWFRREPIHKQLARALEPDAPKAPWREVGIHGIHRLREWDEVRTVESPVKGDRAQFVVLDDAIVIEDGPDDVAPLADALSLEPPFRAEAVRRGALWAVAARRIEVERLDGVRGDELEERVGDVVRRAWRIDGDLFEVRTDPL